MTRSIYDLLERRLPANINNTNNYNNTNDTNNKLTTTTLCCKSNEEEAVTSSSLGQPREQIDSLESKAKKKVAKKLPAEWRGVKLDLFCNGTNKDGSPSLKLNIGVIKHLDGAQVALQASLNSSFDDGVRRGVDKTAWNTDSHWIRVKQHYKELKYLTDARASKIGLKQRHGGTNWVAFVYECDRVWCVDVIREAQIYHFELTDPLSQAQREQGNTIATLYAGVRKQRELIDPRKEWGI